MNRSVFFKLIMALILVAALIGIGVFAFQAGVAHGLALNLSAPSAGSGTPPLPYPYYGMYRFPFFGGFGCFSVLIVLFLLFLAFGSFRMLFGHSPRRWHRMHGSHWGGSSSPCGAGPQGVPPFFVDWHRQAHETPPEPKSE
jgi:hypothetical protein